MSETRKLHRNMERRAYKAFLDQWGRTKEGRSGQFRRPSMSQWKEGVRKWLEARKAELAEVEAKRTEERDASVSKDWGET